MFGWMVVWLDFWLDGWLVGWRFGCLVGWLVGWLDQGVMYSSSPDDKLSENIWFVWFKTSYDGDKWRCYHGDKRTTNNKWK